MVEKGRRGSQAGFVARLGWPRMDFFFFFFNFLTFISVLNYIEIFQCIETFLGGPILLGDQPSITQTYY